MRFRITAALVGLGLLLAGCGGTSSPGPSAGNEGTTPAPASAPVTIVIGINADPPNLDPGKSTALVDRQVQNAIYDKLYDIDENLNIIPMLAADLPQISPDGLEYTIPLRQGIQFTDGTPFNADAVVFTLDRYRQPGSGRYSELSSIDRVEKVDDFTVKIILKKPYSPLLYVLTDRAGMIPSPKAVQEQGDQYGQQPVGTGPFMFESRIKGDQIVLVKNPNYWRQGLPKADKIIYKVVPDDNVKVVNLQSGQLDIIDTVPAQSIAELEANPNLKVAIGDGLGFQGIFLNNQKPPFDNVYLRQAVDLAIDRETLVKVVFQNTASPAYGPFPPVSPAAAASGTPPKVDLQKVKELLAKGGKPNGFSFTLKIAPGPVAQQVAQVVANMLGEAGIQVDIKQVEFGTLLDDLDKGNYEAGAVGWSGRPDPDGNIYVWLHTDGNQNNSKYSNPEVDRLLEKAREVTDMKERVAVYTQVMDIVHRESPYVYLYFPKNVRGYSVKVGGFVNYPDQIIRTANLTKEP